MMKKLFSFYFLIISLLTNCYLSSTNETTNQDDVIINWIYSGQNSTYGYIFSENDDTNDGEKEKTKVKSDETNEESTKSTKTTTTSDDYNDSETESFVDVLMNKVRNNAQLSKELIKFADGQGKHLIQVSAYQFPPLYIKRLEGNDFYWDTKREWGLIVGPFAAFCGFSILLTAIWVLYELKPVQLPLHPTMKDDD